MGNKPRPNRRRCGAKLRRKSAKCQHEAGWGTDHPGYGRCKLHGGASPSGNAAAARLEAQQFMDAGESLRQVEPIDAMLYTVQRGSAIAVYCRRRVATLEEGDRVKDGDVNLWARLELEALDRLARYAKMALDAGVAERRVQMAERLGGMLAAAAEDALAVLGDVVTDAMRRKFVSAFASRLAVLEAHDDGGDDPPRLRAVA